MSDIINLSNLSSTEIDNMRTEKERELQDASRVMNVVEEENHKLAKEILELRIKKKDSDIALDKARHNIRVLASEIKILTNAYWQSRQS